jgi:DNA mismatch repair protein PMS2
MASAGAIKPIDASAVHRICSGQVILDLSTAVKELVENALDAGATTIEVRLKEHGGEMVEVADNGHGVEPDNYQALTLKYHTSKIACFDDLATLGSFGFRGEALSSLCAVSDVSVITCANGQEVGVRLEYDHAGKLVSQEPAPRAVGTTIAVRNLFARMPVRHKEFHRNIKREYAKLVALLQAYALTATKIRLVCTNHTGSGARTVVVSTQGAASVRDNIVAVFGGKVAEAVEPLHVEAGSVVIEGFVSRATAGSGRASGDRQFFYVNGRPVELPKMARALNEAYRSLSSPAAATSKPVAVLDFRFVCPFSLLPCEKYKCVCVAQSQTLWFISLLCSSSTNI